MHIHRTHSRFLTIPLISLLAIAVPSAFAQKTTSSAGSTSSAAGSAGSIPSTRGTAGSIPTNLPGSIPTNPTTPSQSQPIFLSGKVMFDDGTPPNIDIRIERVCAGTPRLEAHTDSKGTFSFQVGQNAGLDFDASDATAGSYGGQNSQFGSVPVGMGQNSNSMNSLWNCDLRAAYPGYSSDVVSLATRKSLDDPDVGTIILHHLANVQGTTISLTSSFAPRHAQRDYEKGMQLAQKGKFDEAEKHFLAATDTYPKYAVAWFALGQVQQRNGKPDEARKSYEAAIKADSKYVSPYDQLALLAAQSGKWQDAADYSKQAISLNPVEFPTSFWYNAVANYNLKRPAEAEKSTLELLKLDTRHRFPQAENMLAQIMADRGDYTNAATHLRAYLKLDPNAKNADALRQALTKMEQASADAQKPPQN